MGSAGPLLASPLLPPASSLPHAYHRRNWCDELVCPLLPPAHVISSPCKIKLVDLLQKNPQPAIPLCRFVLPIHSSTVRAELLGSTSSAALAGCLPAPRGQSSPGTNPSGCQELLPGGLVGRKCRRRTGRPAVGVETLACVKSPQLNVKQNFPMGMWRVRCVMLHASACIDLRDVAGHSSFSCQS